jgi:hypothetical protein
MFAKDLKQDLINHIRVLFQNGGGMARLFFKTTIISLSMNSYELFLVNPAAGLH